MSPVARWELAADDPGFPSCLAEVPYPPERLYGIGDQGLLRPGLGVVGSRKATPYGLSCARTFAGWAAAAGIVVVSGAAAGCDRAAQEAALESGGATVAVLGCGPDVDYPAGSRTMLAEARRRGAVVSELPWGTHASRHAFVRRNRIIAGLSAALLVVEAGLPSGTFSTADFALQAGRDVLAVPGSILSETSRGTNRLIRQGATPVTDVSELTDALGILGADLVPQSLAMASGAPEGDQVTERVAAALLADPLRPDDLARALALDIVTVMRAVARLEETSVVRRYLDGRYGPG